MDKMSIVRTRLLGGSIGGSVRLASGRFAADALSHPSVSGEVMADGFGRRPVFDASGGACGSLTLLGPVSHMKAKEDSRYLERSEECSTRLGYSSDAGAKARFKGLHTTECDQAHACARGFEPGHTLIGRAG